MSHVFVYWLFFIVLLAKYLTDIACKYIVALFGASGNSVQFPSYWGNVAKGNNGYCMMDPAAA